MRLQARRAKSRKARRLLGEEWMEHLIDRMEKEYTAELQVGAAPLLLKMCMRVPGALFHGAGPRPASGWAVRVRRHMPACSAVSRSRWWVGAWLSLSRRWAAVPCWVVLNANHLPPPALQRHPSKWVVQAADPSASDQLPAVSLPSIEEVFPLEKCLQVTWGAGANRGLSPFVDRDLALRRLMGCLPTTR